MPTSIKYFLKFTAVKIRSKNSVREALWRYKDQILKDLKIIKNAVLHQISDSGIPAGLGVRMAVAFLYMVYVIVCIIPATGKQRVLAIFKVICLFGINFYKNCSCWQISSLNKEFLDKK